MSTRAKSLLNFSRPDQSDIQSIWPPFQRLQSTRRSVWVPWSASDAMRRLLMVPCALGLAAGAIGFAPAPAWQTARKWQATRTCRPALGRVALARPLGGQAVRTSRRPGDPLAELRAASSDDDRDEWENYAMLHDVEVEGDENSEDSPVGADLM